MLALSKVIKLYFECSQIFKVKNEFTYNADKTIPFLSHLMFYRHFPIKFCRSTENESDRQNLKTVLVVSVNT